LVFPNTTTQKAQGVGHDTTDETREHSHSTGDIVR